MRSFEHAIQNLSPNNHGGESHSDVDGRNIATDRDVDGITCYTHRCHIHRGGTRMAADQVAGTAKLNVLGFLKYRIGAGLGHLCNRQHEDSDAARQGIEYREIAITSQARLQSFMGNSRRRLPAAIARTSSIASTISSLVLRVTTLIPLHSY